MGTRKRYGVATVERRVAFEGRLLRVEANRVREPMLAADPQANGDASPGPVVSREVVRHPGVAAVVALTPEREVVLVRQFRYAADRVLLEIPAGTLAPDEAPEACAQRELAEETGYRAAGLQPLGSFFTAPGFCDEVIHLYRADDLTPGVPHPDEGEEVEAVLVPIEECRRRLLAGSFEDAKTQVGLALVLLGEAAAESGP